MKNIRTQHNNLEGTRDGFTLIEMVVVIAVIALLAAIVTPLALDVIKDARFTRAQADVASIAKAITKFRLDTDTIPAEGTAATPATPDIYQLNGPGSTPTDSSSGQTWDASGGSPASVSGCVAASTTSDTILNQLLSNTPAYTAATSSTKPGRAAARFPYLNDIDEDPWGNRYMVNIAHMDPDCSVDSNAVFALSAGPDEAIQTRFNMTVVDVAAGRLPSGDDIIARIK